MLGVHIKGVHFHSVGKLFFEYKIYKSFPVLRNLLLFELSTGGVTDVTDTSRFIETGWKL